ncbi:hypothetical protein [Azonexus sp.]|uniref:hypothetical protein n=1 Tax=Azonexus sp. TaxID=1872668 RepID=UPI0035AFBAD5
MKLQHLAIGDRFEYEGKIFVKTGPLTASSDQGGQQIIPRYAVLKPLDQVQPESRAGGRDRLNKAAVLAAFDRFYRTSERLCDPAAQAELARARKEFLAIFE